MPGGFFVSVDLKGAKQANYYFLKSGKTVMSF